MSPVDLISHPFRVVGGSIATVPQGSDDSTAEQLAVLVLTRRGERQMVPLFGVNDPAFQTYDQADIQLGIDLFGPEVELEAIDVSFPTDRTQEAVIRYGVA